MHPYLHRAARLTAALLAHAGVQLPGSWQEAEAVALLMTGVQVGAGCMEETSVAGQVCRPRSRAVSHKGHMRGG